MKLLISTGCFYKEPIEKTFYISEACGFDGVEVILNELYHLTDAAERLLQLSRISKITALHAPFAVSSSKEKIFSLKRSVELAEEVRAETVVFHPPLKPVFDMAFWRWFKRRKWKELGSPKLCVENMPYLKLGPFRLNPFCVHRFRDLKRLSEDGLKIAFDTTHCGTSGIPLIEAFEEAGGTDTVHHIHLSDFRREKGEFVEHLFPGEGELELFEFLKHLKKTGYNKAITLEVSPRYLPEDDRERIAKLKEFLARMRGVLS